MSKKQVPLNPLNGRMTHILLGCDPEFFFTTNNGKVVGSEKILPEEGLRMDTDEYEGYFEIDEMDNHNRENNGNKKPVFIIDGVQAELNPGAGTCRALLGNDIHACFRQLRKSLKKNKKNFKISVDPLVDITQKELDSLSDKSKTFGCDPSQNIYQSRQAAQITVDPRTYLKRSAGGHIHLGTNTPDVRRLLRNAEVIVPLLDLVVGNTCVLIDRHEGNVERRKNYGRAGEYRLKPYGIEYRTLSNFWLHSYQLMSFVMGLSRMTVEMAYQSTKKNNFVKALLDAVPRKDVIQAVQQNNFELAYQNFKKIEPILLDAGGDFVANNWAGWSICKSSIREFLFFVKMVHDKSLKYWFNHDVLTHWCNLREGHGRGWEAFCVNHIRPKMDRCKKDKAIDLNKLVVDNGKPARKINGLPVVLAEA